MNIQQKRQTIHETINSNLIPNYNDEAIALYECPTGSGKTNILLESAYKLLKETKNCVVISTSSNQLALNFLSPSAKADLKKYSNIEINENDIEVMLGKSNFVDKEAVYRAIEEDEEFAKKVSVEEANKWFETKENRQILEKFLSDFALPKEYRDILAITDKSAIMHIEDEMTDENMENAQKDINKVATLQNDTVTVKNFPYFLYEEQKIFVTNHLFLITLIDLLGKEHDFKKISILIDEAHDVPKLATLRYTVSFSAFRFLYLCKAINKQVPCKESKDFNEKALLLHDELKNDSNNHRGNEYYHLILKEFTETFSQKELQKTLTKILKVAKKEKLVNNALNKHFFLIKKEYWELLQCVSVDYQKLEIIFSGKKGFFTGQALKKNPQFELRRNVWPRIGSATLLSGTFRVNAQYKNSKEKNKWTIERLGIIPFSEKAIAGAANEEIKEYMHSFNEKIQKRLTLQTFDWLFDKNNLAYTVIDDDSLNFRNFKDGQYRLDTNKFTENISIFYEYYKPGFFRNQNTLILTTSFQATEELEKALLEQGILPSQIYAATKEKQGSEVIHKYAKAANKRMGNILIGAFPMWTGVDLKGQLCTSIIITKLPYESLTNSNKKNRTDYINKMLLLFRQGIGRGSRSEKDQVAIFIFDNKKIQRNQMAYKFIDEMGREFSFDDKFKKELGDFNEKI